ncbi:MAG: OmpA family protein [Tenuifilaceae bacterium]
MKNNILHKLLLVAGVLFIGTYAIAQTAFKPASLGSAINTEYSEINPVISIDGKTLYFSRANHPQNTYGRINTQDVWSSTLNDDGTWSEAKRLPKSVNIGRFNAILSALDDGKTFFIHGVYNRRGTIWLERGFSLLGMVDNETWSKPKKLDISGYARMNKGKVSNAYMTPDGEYIFIAFTPKANKSKLSIYVSKRKGDLKYSKPKELKGGINKSKSSEAPFLNADKNVLYFSGDFGSSSNDYDLFVSNRAEDNFQRWSKPVPLSDTINTPNWDSYYKLNSKGSRAYYSSTTNSVGKSDIFSVKIFEENPFIKVTGLILNQADQALMLSDTSYSILVNGQPNPGLKVDKASASYEVTLPLGSLYSLKPELKNWNGISNDIDVRDVKEYSESKLNLYLTSIPYILVKGKIIDTRTSLPISLEKNPRVYINGLDSDSVKYDQFSASYQVVLPLGAQYAFEAKVQNFTGKVDSVNVLKETVYQEREVNLYVSSLPWIEVKGLALDNNSFTPILGNSTPKLVIDGVVKDSIQIDAATGEFTLNLPFGKSYNTSIIANEFSTLENTLDLTGYVEYTTVKHNVFAERKDVNMAILSGKVMNTKTDKPLEPGIPVKLKVNGVVSAAFKYDSTKAEYILKLPIGYVYDLLPTVYNFYNKFEPVDLTKVASMTKIPKNFYVTPIEVGQSVDIEHIYYETAKAELKPESFRSLNALVTFLNEYPNVKVEISGHTDNTGSAEINQKISEQRAQSVSEYVISMGVQASRIVTKGYGLTKPKYTNKTAQGRAKNRRVEFMITGI